MSVKPYVEDRWGILNPWGDFWTNETFDVAEDAQQHLRDFWKDREKELGDFRVIPVRVTIEALSGDTADAGRAPMRATSDGGVGQTK